MKKNKLNKLTLKLEKLKMKKEKTAEKVISMEEKIICERKKIIDDFIGNVELRTPNVCVESFWDDKDSEVNINIYF